ncbi:MAG TPA: polysaccharide biosynthesis tyrosine autokinase, partial [Gemmatimonadaceae bacterium]|nr:polysaccharide biosynthesis tyrosine autokinase [Gemmatimonadaceae bacterium]
MLQLHVNLRPHTDVIDITYSDPDAHRAQRVVNKLADVFQTRNAYDAQRVARLRRQLLEREIRENDSLLANAESALIAFRTRSRLFSSHQELGELQHDLLQSDMQYEQLKSERDVYASLLDRVDRDASKGTPGGGIHAFLLPQVITQNPAVEPTFRELQRYESSRDSLTTGQWRAAATNPDVLRLDSLIVLTKAKLEGAVRSHVAMLDAQLGAFRRFRARYGSAMNDLPALEAEEQRLLPRAEMLRDAGQKLREQLQQAQMEETVETGDVEIVDRATLPIIPDLSLRPLKVGLGLVVGLIFGGVAAFLREMGTQSVRRREDLEGVLHVRGLAAIPHANGNGGAPGRRYLPLSSRRTSGAHSVAANGNGSSSALVTLARTSSPGAEAFRILGANLTAGGAGTGPRMFVVTSAMPGEGKTVTAVNLAVICARNGMRVLLVDGDLRHGQLHRLFDVPQEPGFTDLLASDAPAEVAARATSEERLWLLVRGSALDNPAQALTGASARTVLAALAGYFDLLIVDTPPVLAVADAAILAAQADGVILVVRAGQVSLAAARQTHDRLVSVGATILGAVLNDPSGQAPRSANEYGYFDQYAGAQYVDTQQVDSYIATTRLADSYRPDAAPVMDMRIETRPVVEPPAGAGPGAAPPAGAPPARDTNTLDA